MSEKVEGYKLLLKMTYEEAGQYLVDKYGAVKDDYFRENSYYRFLNGEIKSIAKGKFSKAQEGLYCHHMDEDKEYNLSNKEWIMVLEPPFDYQKRERLVYCDLFEHLILHALIMGKTEGEYGTPGFTVMIRPQAKEWFIDPQKIPKPTWMQTARKRAYLDKEEAKELLKAIDEYLLKAAPHTIEKRVNYEREQERKRIEEEERTTKEFDKQYPHLRKNGIDKKTTRKNILRELKKFDNEHKAMNEKEYNLFMINVTRDKLFSLLDSKYKTMGE